VESIDDLLGLVDEPVQVVMPRTKKTVRLRWPTFAEWHELAVEHRKLNGADPSAELVAKTVAVCVADENGNRKYGDGDLSRVAESGPRGLMWLYGKCWETVLRNDDQAVKEEEGK
jgi:hypothetical protein